MEEKELPIEKDEEETPKRRRSSRSTTIQQKKSPKAKRSPSPPELSETVSKSTFADSEEITEERVPPLLSLEGFQHRVSVKQMTTTTEKAVSPKFLHKESLKSHRSPQKGGRYVRERNESNSNPPAPQPSAATCTIQQTPNWCQEAEKVKPKIQDSHMTQETVRGSMTRGATTKDVKVKSSLVLIKPPVRSKSGGKAYVREQSLHIVEKSSSRGVQAMSILEKQEPESKENKERTITLSSCPEVGRSNVKTMSILEKVDKDKLDANSAVCSDAFESDKTVVSSVSVSSLPKTRKLRVRSSSSNRKQPETNILKTVNHPDIQEKHETEVLNVSLDVAQTPLPAWTKLDKPELQSCGLNQTKEVATDLPSVQDKESLLTVTEELTEKSNLGVSHVSGPDVIGGITISTDHSLGKEVSHSGSVEVQQPFLGNLSSEKEEPMHMNEISEIKQTEVKPAAEEDLNMFENTVQLKESVKLEQPNEVASEMVLGEIPLKPFAEISVLESEATTGTHESSASVTETFEDSEITERASAITSDGNAESLAVHETMTCDPDLQKMSDILTPKDAPQITSHQDIVTKPVVFEQSTFPSSKTEYSITSELDTQVDDVAGVQITHEAMVKNQAPFETPEKAISDDEIITQPTQDFLTAIPDMTEALRTEDIVTKDSDLVDHEIIEPKGDKEFPAVQESEIMPPEISTGSQNSNVKMSDVHLPKDVKMTEANVPSSDVEMTEGNVLSTHVEVTEGNVLSTHVEVTEGNVLSTHMEVMEGNVLSTDVDKTEENVLSKDVEKIEGNVLSTSVEKTEENVLSKDVEKTEGNVLSTDVEKTEGNDLSTDVEKTEGNVLSIDVEETEGNVLS
ncbi:unnamed protein product, partial [Staurois parvus]